MPFVWCFLQACSMKAEEQNSDTRSKIQSETWPVPFLAVGDLKAAEDLMSMTNPWNTRDFRERHTRPLTPNSESSEDDAVPSGLSGLHNPSFVSELFRPNMKDLFYFKHRRDLAGPDLRGSGPLGLSYFWGPIHIISFSLSH